MQTENSLNNNLYTSDIQRLIIDVLYNIDEYNEVINEDEKFTFDFYSGHPTNTGYYHYHSSTKGPLEVLSHKGLIQTPTVGSGEIELFGMMCDGTLILGCTELDGSVPSNNDFDVQNGHLHDITDGTNIYFSNRYHTHVCTDTYTGHKFTPEIQYYEGCN